MASCPQAASGGGEAGGRAAVPASAVASYDAIARLLDGGDGAASRSAGQSLMRSARRPTLALATAVQDGRAASPRNGAYYSHLDGGEDYNGDDGYDPTAAYQRTVMGGKLPPPPESASTGVPAYASSYGTGGPPPAMLRTARKQQYVRKLVKRALRKQQGSYVRHAVAEWADE